MAEDEYRDVEGTYQVITLTGTSVAHEIDANKETIAVRVKTSADLHFRFGSSGVITYKTGEAEPDPMIASVDPVRIKHLKKADTHIAVLAPGGSGSLELWHVHKIERNY